MAETADGPDAATNRAEALVAAHLKAGKRPNRLIDEKSPYLLQHAFNPVDWYPWGEEAFEAARAQGKPLFVSVGYSTCHWCHVMERESFEDESIAASMNEHFVNVKIDREERPDVDHIYMTVVQAMTGSGGWPMSVFLTPKLEPFYAGTYFPPRGAYGRPGFTDVLNTVADQWQQDRGRIETSAGRIVETISRNVATRSRAAGAAHRGQPVAAPAAGEAHPTLQAVYDALRDSFDRELGGFGGAPKFPRPSVFSALLLHHHRTGEPDSLEMTTKTLRQMAAGGMYDQLAGGFHRYSVDASWRVPHFEKMLYDQAQLASALVAAHQVTGSGHLRAVAIDVLAYVIRDLQGPEGGFYSAEDADSATDPERPENRVEGGFYTWTLAELGRALGEHEGPEAAARYGLTARGNTISDPHGDLGNRNVLFRSPTAVEAEAAAETATQGDGAAEAADADAKGEPGFPMPQRWRRPLLEARDRRPRPLLDDKVIAAWNGLMIAAVADAALHLGRDDFGVAAARAVAFIQEQLIDGDGRLLRRYRGGEARFAAGLGDYGAVVHGLQRFYQACGDLSALETAAGLTEVMLDQFCDDQGQLHDTPEGASDLIIRSRELYDAAEPAGTSMAVLALLQMGHLLGTARWVGAAHRALDHALGEAGDHPVAVPLLAAAADLAARPPAELVLAGDWQAAARLRQELQGRYLPDLAIVHLTDDTAAKWLGQRLPAVPDMARSAKGGTADAGYRPMAFLCEGFVCQAPVDTAAELASLLDESGI